MASALAGLLAGAGLGAVGAATSLEMRIAAASLLALAAVGLGIAEATGRGIPLLQCDRETPQRWVHVGPLAWAARNGLTLGCGATSRIGFWSWYLIPTGALLTGDPIGGALLYGCYGLTRGLAAWGWIAAGRLAPRFGLTFEDLAIRLLMSQPWARSISGACLLLVGSAVVAAIGI